MVYQEVQTTKSQGGIFTFHLFIYPLKTFDFYCSPHSSRRVLVVYWEVYTTLVISSFSLFLSSKNIRFIFIKNKFTFHLFIPFKDFQTAAGGCWWSTGRCTQLGVSWPHHTTPPIHSTPPPAKAAHASVDRFLQVNKNAPEKYKYVNTGQKNTSTQSENTKTQRTEKSADAHVSFTQN